MCSSSLHTARMLVKTLKGAPYAVLALLAQERLSGGAPVEAQWLMLFAGYSDKPVTQALRLLEAYGLAERGKGGWLATESGLAIFPFAPASRPAEESRPDRKISDDADDPQAEADEEPGRENADLPPDADEEPDRKISDRADDPLPDGEGGTDRKNADFGSSPPDADESRPDRKISDRADASLPDGEGEMDRKKADFGGSPPDADGGTDRKNADFGALPPDRAGESENFARTPAQNGRLESRLESRLDSSLVNLESSLVNLDSSLASLDSRLDAPGVKNLHPGPAQAEPKRAPKPELLAELTRLRINEPARSELAALEHVTVELIRYHAAECNAPGQLIYRLRHNWPMRRANGSAPVTRPAPVQVVDDEDEDDQPLDGPNNRLEDDPKRLWAWDNALGRLRGEIPAVEFHNWVSHVRLSRVEGQTWVVFTANQWGVERFAEKGWDRRLGELLTELTHEPADVRVEVGDVFWGRGGS